ncbi:mitogen-activated protein [Salix suchowensis]|nr:mitogen-activated protein [Salix suchowensis]
MLKHIYEEEGQRREQVISADVDNEREEGNLPRIDETAVLSESPISNISPNGRFRRVFTSWEKGELLGRGSFGSVYKGISHDGHFFAVKEVSLLDQGTRGKQSIYQLEQEIALLSRFEHENIVQYYGTDKDESKLYIFLELVTQGSLQKLYQTYNLQDSQVSPYTRQILHGLKYLHDQKVVHRDIKCANLLVDANGSVKLADFGLAKATKLNDVKSCKGTAFWMAPEVVNNKNQGYGLSADIWSLGCTVLEMLTRQIPYSELESVSAIFDTS